MPKKSDGYEYRVAGSRPGGGDRIYQSREAAERILEESVDGKLQRRRVGEWVDAGPDELPEFRVIERVDSDDPGKVGWFVEIKAWNEYTEIDGLRTAFDIVVPVTPPQWVGYKVAKRWPVYSYILRMLRDGTY